jgi:hypothetical protein
MCTIFGFFLVLVAANAIGLLVPEEAMAVYDLATN